MKSYFLSIILAFSTILAAAACAQTPSTPASAETQAKAPQITLTTNRLVHPAHLEMKGTGFTPKGNALSHLKRSDGTEFPVLHILTDARGEFVHDVDSLLLAVGTHELWVFDETTGAQSNVAKFDVVRE
jgi:hypothetical protein